MNKCLQFFSTPAALAVQRARRVGFALRLNFGLLSSAAVHAWAGSLLGALASSFAGAAVLVALGLALVQAAAVAWLLAHSLAQPHALAGPAAAGAWPQAYVNLIQAHAHAQAQAAAPTGAIVNSTVGERPAHQALAPCAQIEAFSAPGAPLWGATRVGLRCKLSPQSWSLWMPVQVRVMVPALVASKALVAGSALPTDAQAWSVKEIDLAVPTAGLNREAASALRLNPVNPWQVHGRVDPNLPIARPEQLAGRMLARPLAAGQALRHGHLAAQQWFNTGATVQVLAHGEGFAVRTEAQALGPGLDGQAVRVRTESGRVLTGWAFASHAVQLQPQTGLQSQP